MEKSHQALMSRGFRPQTSSLTPVEMTERWLAMVHRLFLNKPTREDYITGQGKDFQGQIYSQARQLTRVRVDTLERVIIN